MMTEQNMRSLAAAITMQAVKDYFRSTKEEKKKAVLKDLRSSWMQMLTDGQSVVVAEQLEKHPEEIRERLRRNGELKS